MNNTSDIKQKNFGLDLEKEAIDQSKEDFVFGVGEPIKGLAEGINLTDYLPKGEIQRTSKGDMMDCATRAPINMLETKLNYIVKSKKISISNMTFLQDNDYIGKDGCIALSDAYTSIKSGTTTNGNSLIAPCQAIHKWGVVPKSLMPLESWMNWWDYHNKARITPIIEALGLEFARRFPVNYERVVLADFPNVIKWDIIDTAGYAWPAPKNGVYPRTSYTPNHAFMYFSNPKYKIFDNYIDSVDGDFIKQLASDYRLWSGYRLIVNEVVEEKKKMTTEQLNKLYTLGLKREIDDLAQPYLNHDIEFVIDELLKSKEHESISKWVNFLRSFGLTLGK